MLQSYITYKGHKIYEPKKIDFYGKPFYQYWPPEMSSVPTNGYPTKEAYYLAMKNEIDEKIKYGTWTDFFGPLL